MTPQAERRAMTALVAAFALLVQAPFPAMAAAGPLSGPGLAICAETGSAAAPRPNDSLPATPAAPGHGCDHCLCPAPAPAALAAVIEAPAGVVRYASAAPRLTATTSAVRPGRGLAAPPPPARGPPAPNA